MAQVEDYTGTPTVFDSTSTQRNVADFGRFYVVSGAHRKFRLGRGTNVLFFDGHVEWLQQKPTFQAITPLPAPIIIDLSRTSRGKTSKAR